MEGKRWKVSQILNFQIRFHWVWILSILATPRVYQGGYGDCCIVRWKSAQGITKARSSCSPHLRCISWSNYRRYRLFIAKHNILLVLVSNNMTHMFQPLDLTVNKHCKTFLKNLSSEWYLRQLKKWAVPWKKDLGC